MRYFSSLGCTLWTESFPSCCTVYRTVQFKSCDPIHRDLNYIFCQGGNIFAALSQGQSDDDEEDAGDDEDVDDKPQSKKSSKVRASPFRVSHYVSGLVICICIDMYIHICEIEINVCLVLWEMSQFYLYNALYIS